MKEVEEEEDEGTNGFDDWERLHCNNYYRHSPPSLSSSSPHSLSPKLTTHHHHSHLSVFPPVNHEGLPFSQTTPTLSNSNSIVPPSPPPPPPSSTHRNSKLISWFDLALHLWNSKILSLITRIRIPWFLLSLRPVAAAASIMAVFWFWVRRRRKRCGGDGRIEQLKLLVKEKDEILLLLEQIAAMNKELLTRYRIPILKST